MRISSLAGLGVLSIVALSGCSKTEDTAPETRIFGEPPVINSVTFSGAQRQTVCDVTPFAMGFLCSAGITTDLYTFLNPQINFTVGYTDVFIQVSASDPNTTATENDILLVGASYVHGSPPVETTLLVFDDGSTFDFPLTQAGSTEQDCDIDPAAPVCSPCTGASYILKSNDTVANDGLFTRGYAFASVGGNLSGPYAANCIADSLKRPPVSTSDVLNSTIGFKIEAVDRSGNIATWPDQPTVTVGASSFACTGDPCACCLLTQDQPDPACRGGLEGVIGVPGSGFEAGLCRTILP